MAVNLGTINVKLMALTRQFDAGIVGAGKKLEALEKPFKKVAAASTVAAAGMALIGFKAVKMSARFDQAMTSVAAKTGDVDGSFKMLREGALDLAADTKFTATEVASGMEFMAQAGFSAAKILESIGPAATLAAAAATDLGTAADVVTNIMSGMGVGVDELAHLSDLLVSAVTGANTTLEQMGLAFKFVGPVARTAGQSMEEVTAALALMGNAGIQGSMAGTALRGALSRLAKNAAPTARVLKDLGVKALDGAGNLLPLRDILVQLQPHANKTGALMTLFGDRAGPGMAALLGQGIGAFDAFTERLSKAGGTAQAIADAQIATLAGQFAILNSQVERIAIDLGSELSPAMSVVVDASQKLAKKIIGLDDETKSLVATTGLLVTVTLASLAAFTGMVATLPFVIEGYKALKIVLLATSSGFMKLAASAFVAGGAMLSAIGSAAAAAAVAIGPLLFVLFGVAALVASLAELWKFWIADSRSRLSGFIAQMTRGWDNIAAGAAEMVDLASAIFRVLVDNILMWFSDKVPKTFQESWNNIIKMTRGLGDSLSGMFSKAAKDLMAPFKVAFNWLKKGFKKLSGWISVAAEFWGKKFKAFGIDLGVISLPELPKPGATTGALVTADDASDPTRPGGGAGAAPGGGGGAGGPVGAFEIRSLGIGDALAGPTAAVQDMAASVLAAREEETDAAIAAARAGVDAADDQARAAQDMAQTISEKFGEVGQIVSNAIGAFREGGASGAVFSVIGDLIDRSEGMQKIVSVLNGALDEVVSVMEPAVQAVGRVTSQLTRFLTPIFKALGRVVGTLVPVIDSLLGFLSLVTPIFDAIGEMMGSLVPVLDVLSGALGGVIDVISTVLGPVLRAFATAIDWLAGAISTVVEFFTGGDFLELLEEHPEFARILGRVNPLLDQMREGLAGVVQALPAAGRVTVAENLGQAESGFEILNESLRQASFGLDIFGDKIITSSEDFSQLLLASMTEARDSIEAEGASLAESIEFMVKQFGIGTTVEDFFAFVEDSGFDLMRVLEFVADGFSDLEGAALLAEFGLEELAESGLFDSFSEMSEVVDQVTESLSNMPSGFKIALARFEAIQAEAATGGFGILSTAAGSGIGAGAAVAAPGSSGGGVHIDRVEMSGVSDVFTFLEEMDRTAQQAALLQFGVPQRPSPGSPFSVPLARGL